MITTRSQKLLREDFARRAALKPRLSLRSYARFLGLSPSFVSAVLKGKKELSVASAFKVAKKLGYSRSQTFRICKVIRERRDPSELRQLTRMIEGSRSDFRELALDHFALISEWYHYAILELSLCIRAPLTPLLISRRLGISKGQSREAIDRLLRLGLLARDSNGRIRKTSDKLRTPSDIPSHALRSHHSQLMDKAKQALASQPVEQRDITSITLSISKKAVAEAKAEIRKFRRKMATLLSDQNPDSVYQLNIQFFELTRGP